MAAVAMIIFTIVSVTTIEGKERGLFGFRAFIVLSDSMSETDFDAGDLVIVKETDPVSLKEGDIIAFISRNDDNYGETATHKIRKLTTEDDGTPGFITYGTTTGTDDEAVVVYEDVLGVYEGRIPKVGRFFAFLKTQAGFWVCIFTPLLLIVLAQGSSCIQLFRAYRQEKADEREKKD